MVVAVFVVEETLTYVAFESPERPKMEASLT